jgi:hypothetical protein
MPSLYLLHIDSISHSTNHSQLSLYRNRVINLTDNIRLRHSDIRRDKVGWCFERCGAVIDTFADCVLCYLGDAIVVEGVLCFVV